MSNYIRSAATPGATRSYGQALGASSSSCCTFEQISQATMQGVMPDCPCPETPAATAPEAPRSPSTSPVLVVAVGVGLLWLLTRKKR